MAVVVEEFVPVFFQEAGPTVFDGYPTGLRIGRLRPLISHFQKEQIRQLLDVVAIAHSVVAEDVTIIPKFLNDRSRTHKKMAPNLFMANKI
jgi:hypothetical protein